MEQELYCCIGTEFEEPFFDYKSLSYKKSIAIKKHCEGSNWTWLKWKKKGWICKKVKVTFEEITIF